MGSDEDRVLQAFVAEWQGWQPRRLYTPIHEKDLLAAADLPSERASRALVNLLNAGLLARRGAIGSRSDVGWMYQFTVEGARVALERGFLAEEEAPPLP